ncbi:MAG: ABC transporter ATP-binding protein [Desulfarculaceae bacterium]|jgi:ABC-2 type transport system ATP-binding protein
MATVIETQELTKVYGTQAAVDNLSLSVDSGEIFGFLGPNGAGKTTTLLMLLGLTEPTSGQAQVLGLDPVRDPLGVKRKVGYLPENMGFYGDLTARENLAYVARLNRFPEAEIAQRVETALETVGLTPEADKLAGAYSRGMRQRLGIAELMVKEPQLVFLDEPTLGLDPEGINRMLDLITSLSKERGITVLLSSHLLHQVQRICNRVGIMIQGRMVASGPIDQLAEQTFGQGQETFTLEDVYMRYFTEA